MREKLEIKKHYSILSILGLVFFLLLSPCKVRNFIQAELGLPQTNVLNKSQTTLSSSNCLSVDVAKTNHSFTASSSKVFDNLTYDDFFAFYLPAHSKIIKTPRISESKRILSLSLYILYQNFQVYL